LDGWSRFFAWGLPSGLIVSAAIVYPFPSGLIGKLASLLGDASYAIYLTHIFVAIAYAYTIKHTSIGYINQIIPVIIVSLICCAAGILAHLLIERPIFSAIKSHRTMARNA
jgi:peptidoglycan/LPS O-acetylase OafA/YrhL